MKIILNEKQIKSMSLLEENATTQIPQACKDYYSEAIPQYYVDSQANRDAGRAGKQKGVKLTMSDEMKPAFELCYELNSNQWKYKQWIMFPLVSAIVEYKRDKWVDAVGEEEIKQIYYVLDELERLDPTKKWRWPAHLEDLGPGKRATYVEGTPTEFKDRLKDQAFLYGEIKDSEVKEWLSVNKLDGNYADASKFITDIILQYFDIETIKEINSQLVVNNKPCNERNPNCAKLLEIVDNLQMMEEGSIFDAFLKDDTEYAKWATYYSEQGEKVENFVSKSLQEKGYTIIHQAASGGDPIDVLLGIDLIVSDGSKLFTCQVKKVAKIEHQAETTLRTCQEGGAYRIAPGNMSLTIRQKQNLDWVGYGTLKGEAIVAARQREVKGSYAAGYYWGDGHDLPVGRGYFFIDDPVTTLNVPKVECSLPQEQDWAREDGDISDEFVMGEESSMKIKITEDQAESLEKNDSEERRIRTMLKDMVGRAPWLVEEGDEMEFFEPIDNRSTILQHHDKTKNQWEKEVMEEIIKPVYRLYGFNEDEKEFVFTLFKENLANDPDHEFNEVIIPSPFPFKTGHFNAGGTHRVGELDGVYKKDIEKVFGPPTWEEGSADNKVQLEWTIKFPDGTIGTIYDYKQYNLPPEDIDYWSIGGRTGLADYYIKKSMGLI